MTVTETKVELVIFTDDGVIIPVDKIAHIQRNGTGVRIYLVSYGFVDVSTSFMDVVEQLIGAY